MFMFHHKDVVRNGKMFHMLSNIIVIPSKKLLIVAGNLIDHAGKNTDGFEHLHLENGYDRRNSEGIRLLDLCIADNLGVSNPFFKKKKKLIDEETWHYILVEHGNIKCTCNVKVSESEECIFQHNLFMADKVLKSQKSRSKSNCAN